ncbi:MAG: hypothetical protein FWD73_03935 [Polyangiaceae bacterium]|nr:hypothetical protein [Polyangiaceae bacterium]
MPSLVPAVPAHVPQRTLTRAPRDRLGLTSLATAGKHPLRAWVTSGVVAASIIMVAIAACSNGGEGARCETANGNSDCQSGLVCLPGKQAAPSWNNADWCCPSDRSTATAAPCVQGQGTVIGADDAAPSQTLPDTSVPEASVDSDDSAADASASDDANGS